MADQRTAEVKVQLTPVDDDIEVLDELSRSLLAEINELNVESVRLATEKTTEKGAKAADLVAVGAILVTLAPTVLPALVDLLKTWTTRRPTIPVKMKLNRGDKQVELEYDPATMKATQVNALVRKLEKTLSE